MHREQAKMVTILIDYEGGLADSWKGRFDVEENTQRLLNVLKNHQAKAAFNVCGQLAKKHPETIKTIHRFGHEISLHGLYHENIEEMTKEEINIMLEIAESHLKDAVGVRPIGFRPPWLLRSKNLLEVLEERKYKWLSDQYFTFFPASVKFGFGRYESFLGSSLLKFAAVAWSKWKWRGYPKKPYRIGSLLEIPLLSPMDGDLGLSKIIPDQRNKERTLHLALEAWKYSFEYCKEYFNLNLHDWIIATQNRTNLLDAVLDYLDSRDVVYSLPSEIVRSRLI